MSSRMAGLGGVRLSLQSALWGVYLMVGLLAGIMAEGAWGHAVIVESFPSPQAVLAQAPQVIRLRFNVKIEKAFARVRLRDPQGRLLSLPIPESNFASDADPTTCLALFPPSLASGVYEVHYRILATDGHTTEGMFSFQVDDSE